jgi:hypothetical protein
LYNKSWELEPNAGLENDCWIGVKNIQRKKQQAASFIIWYSTIPAFSVANTQSE